MEIRVIKEYNGRFPLKEERYEALLLNGNGLSANGKKYNSRGLFNLLMNCERGIDPDGLFHVAIGSEAVYFFDERVRQGFVEHEGYRGGILSNE